MQTILVASSKGGAGKTTLSTQLAGHFAVNGKATVLVDADPQGSSTRWCEKRADMETAVLPVNGHSRAFRKHLPESTRFTALDGVGHIPMFEAPGRIADLIRDFLDEQIDGQRTTG